MVRAEPQRIDLDRWPALVPPTTDEGTGPAEVARSLRSSARALALRVDYPDSSAAGDFDAPHRLVLAEPARVWSRLSASGVAGFAEAFMAGEWTTSDLVGVLGVLLPWIAEHPDCGRPSTRTRRELRSGARGRSGPTDLDDGLPGDLVSLYTDETMSTTAAVFAYGARTRSSSADGTETVHLEAPSPAPHVTDLGDAQRRAAEMLLGLSGLDVADTVLVCPAGWGEVAMRAAERGGRVRTVTTSTERLGVLGARFSAAGLQSSIALSLDPLSSVTGTFDAVVAPNPAATSDAAGIREVVDASRRLLRPSGRLVLQTELATGLHSAALGDLGRWRCSYITDQTPTTSEHTVAEIVAERPGLRYRGAVDLTAHHAETVRLWRELFAVRGRDAAALGFDSVFRRMWAFHLAAAEAALRGGWTRTVQTVHSRGEDR